MVAELTTTVPVADIKTPLVDIEPTSFVPLRYAFPWSEDRPLRRSGGWFVADDRSRRRADIRD